MGSTAQFPQSESGNGRNPGQRKKPFLGRDLLRRERAADVGGVNGAVSKALEVHLVVAR